MNASAPAAFAHAGPQATRRVVIAAAVVLLVNVVLFAIMLTVREKPVERPLESLTITAELISAAPRTGGRPRSTPVVRAAQTRSSRATSETASGRPSHAGPEARPDSDARQRRAIIICTARTCRDGATRSRSTASCCGRSCGSGDRPRDARDQCTKECRASRLQYREAGPSLRLQALRRKWNGRRTFRGRIGRSHRGHPGSESSGYTRRDDAALDAMRDSACRPYLEDGKPLRAAYSQPFAFSLTN